MDVEIVLAIMVLVLIGSHSFSAMGRYIPKRRRYSYLHYDDMEGRLPLMAWVHFWIVVGSYVLGLWLIMEQ